MASNSTPTLAQLQQQIQECMSVDRHSLQRRLNRIQKSVRQGQSGQKDLQPLAAAISISQNRLIERRANLPDYDYPESLPVSSHHQDIAQAIRENQVVILAGETGSGKTTQLPKICLEAGRGIAGLIGHTQPRRIAARSVANRIAEELGCELGSAVGYKVRFSDHTHQNGYIKLMTDGILLAELQQDHYLSQYDTLIIDEAHERSLNIDFLLGYLKRLLPRRSDLKLIITSATIDTERFSHHFSHAPVFEVSGRTYPVDIQYRPLGGDDESTDSDLVSGILEAIDELARVDRHGDILVFLNGERDIREMAEALRKHHPKNTEILPLYSRLSAAEQNRIFKPGTGQRIVLSTNVAETSLTVPGIRFVIDPGTARISRYSFRSKVQRLPIEKISQSSANQRAGRCGRVSHGVCIRLYSEDDFAARAEFTEPEIQRTNLASVILQMRQLGLGNPGEFPFIDPPDSRFINDGYRLLQELNALDDDRQLTELGRDLARLPIDPRIGRMIIEARSTGCLQELLILASALSVQEPRERPMDKQQQADEKHAKFKHEDSDFMALLTLWNDFQENKKSLSNNQLRKYCRQHFLSFLRMLEWQSTYQQLRTLVKGMGMTINQEPAEYETIHQSLLTGLLGNIGMRAETKKKRNSAKRSGRESSVYQGARSTEFYLFPGASIAKRSPRWIMAAELVETSRLFARYIARIEPQWIEVAAGHLIKRSYTEPHWDRRHGIVSAYETVTLYGLILHARRRIHFGQIDTEISREIFIREALVRGELNTKAEFLSHNQRLIAAAEAVEDKTRRRDVVVDEENLYRFFDQVLPDDIHSAKAFDRWRKQAEKKSPELLKLKREQVVSGNGVVGESDYPPELVVNDVVIPLSYCFDPGGDEDGITATIPLGAINQIDPLIFDWLVPGFLQEKITILLKGLPKSLRRQLVPIPSTAEKIFELFRADASRENRDLIASLQRELNVNYSVSADRSDWRVEGIPQHLQMRYQILDSQGVLLGAGRDLDVLKQQFAQKSREEVSEVTVDQQWPEQGITRWDFGDLQKSIVVARGGSRYRVYPALMDKIETVGIQLLDAENIAYFAHGDGLIRLVMLSLSREMKYLRRNIPQITRMSLHYTQLGTAANLKDDLVYLTIKDCFFQDGFDIRSQQDFLSLLQARRPFVNSSANRICDIVDQCLASFHRINTSPYFDSSAGPVEIYIDIEKQLEKLIYPGFLKQVSLKALAELPRYLAAIEFRLEKLTQNPAADAQKLVRLHPYLSAYQSLTQRAGPESSAQLEVLRWMLEEFRVSLFAQSLGTMMPISAKRLDAQIALCENKI